MVVQFQEGERLLSAPTPRTLTDFFMRTGLAKSPRGAAALMLITGLLLLAGAAYLIAISL